jgi:hypothetical protein
MPEATFLRSKDDLQPARKGTLLAGRGLCCGPQWKQPEEADEAHVDGTETGLQASYLHGTQFPYLSGIASDQYSTPTETV